MKEKLKTRRELAKLLAVHVDSITRWQDEGLPITRHGGQGKPSLYSESAVRSWLAQRADAGRTSGAADLTRERTRREAASAQLAEQAFQQRAGILIPQAEVDKAWGAEVAAVRQLLLAMSSTWSDRFARAYEVGGMSAMQRAINEATRDVLRELSDPNRPIAEPESVQ